MSFTSVRVTATETLPAGSPSPTAGTVVFTLSQAMSDGAGNIAPTTPYNCTIRTSDGKLLGPDGNPGVELPANNDPSTFPQGTTYQVMQVITYGAVTSYNSFNVTVPYTAAGGTIDLSALLPATIPPSPPPVQQETARAKNAESVAQANASAAVTTANAAQATANAAVPKAGGTMTGDLVLYSAAPATAASAANKAYVDSVAQGLTTKAPVAALAASNVALSGLQTIDGHTLLAAERVLLTAQSTASQNGIWVASAGAWSRPSDFATQSNQTSAYCVISYGNTYASEGWVLSGTVQVDVSSETWLQFSGAGQITAGTAMTKSGNTLNVALGTGSNTAAAGNDSRITGAAADSSVVHLAGTESITGTKSFTQPVTAPTPTASGHVPPVDANLRLPAADTYQESTRNSVARRRWQAALKGATSPSLVILGDSVTDRWGASARKNGYASLLQSALQSRYGLGGAGDIDTGGFNPTLATATFTSAGEPSFNQSMWTLAGTNNGLTTWGPAMLALQLASSSSSATLTGQANRVRVFYGKASSSGQMTITIKQGATTLVTTNIDTYNATNTDGFMYDSGDLALATTAPITVQITPTLGGGNPSVYSVILEDVHLSFGTGASGLQVYPFSHPGWKAQDFAGAAANTWDACVAKCNPDAIVVELGINDHNIGRTVSQFQTDLTSIVTRLQAITTGFGSAAPAIYLMAMYDQPTGFFPVPSGYQAAVYAVAASMGCDVIDVHQAVLDGTQGYIYSDANHPSDGGHNILFQTAMASLDVGGSHPKTATAADISPTKRLGVPFDSVGLAPFGDRALSFAVWDANGKLGSMTPATGAVVTPNALLGLQSSAPGSRAQVLGPLPTASALSWASPSAKTALAGDAALVASIDTSNVILTNAVFRIAIYVTQAFSASFIFRLQLSTNGSSWTDVTGGDVAGNATGLLRGSYAAGTVTGASYARIVGLNGDGTTTGKITSASIEYH